MSLKTNNNKSYNLVEGSIKKSLIRMTTPMIIGMLMLFTFSLVDTWFISFLGTESLTAISFTFPVTFTVMSLAIGLGIGASAVVAKCIGRSEFDRAKEAATVINYISFLLAATVVTILWLFMEDIFKLMGASDQLFVLIRQPVVRRRRCSTVCHRCRRGRRISRCGARQYSCGVIVSTIF